MVDVIAVVSIYTKGAGVVLYQLPTTEGGECVLSVGRHGDVGIFL
jgi:hypothetical protein